jgi:hypothetical protein
MRNFPTALTTMCLDLFPVTLPPKGKAEFRALATIDSTAISTMSKPEMITESTNMVGLFLFGHFSRLRYVLSF